MANEYIDFLKECYAVASQQSDDLSNQNAAMIITSTGEKTIAIANRIPDGVVKMPERIKQRPLKYDFIEHAERGVIYYAAKYGHRLNGATLVCPWIACADCSRAIVCSGIRTVVTHKQRNELTSRGRDKVLDTVSDRWINPISSGAAILKEAGIEVVQLDFKAGMLALINEELVEV